jgi:hypothetical protein
MDAANGSASFDLWALLLTNVGALAIGLILGWVAHRRQTHENRKVRGSDLQLEDWSRVNKWSDDLRSALLDVARSMTMDQRRAAERSLVDVFDHADNVVDTAQGLGVPPSCLCHARNAVKTAHCALDSRKGETAFIQSMAEARFSIHEFQQCLADHRRQLLRS